MWIQFTFGQSTSIGGLKPVCNPNSLMIWNSVHYIWVSSEFSHILLNYYLFECETRCKMGGSWSLSLSTEETTTLICICGEELRCSFKVGWIGLTIGLLLSLLYMMLFLLHYNSVLYTSLVQGLAWPDPFSRGHLSSL